MPTYLRPHETSSGSSRFVNRYISYRFISVEVYASPASEATAAAPLAATTPLAVAAAGSTAVAGLLEIVIIWRPDAGSEIAFS